MEDKKIKIGITHGDLNGIGYEVILKTFTEPRMLEMCIPILYGSSKVAIVYKKMLDLEEFSFVQIQHPSEAQVGKFNLINVITEEIKVEPGISSVQSGRAALAALEKATEDVKAGVLDALVTAPINKDNIQSKDFHFPGHTEYLETRWSEKGKSLMILACDQLKVAVATGHIPFSEVPAAITQEMLTRKLKMLDASLKTDYGKHKPRIAILSLNPHAGENGLLGKEEQETIIPVIEKATEEGFLCFGPYPADGFFGSGKYASFDGVLAMYHDQGLIPFKALAMESGVNFTASLPFVRTSPAHGTGYDIAGKNQADESSFRHAVYMAIDIWNSRIQETEYAVNPLRRQYRDRGNEEDITILTEDN